MKMEPRNDIPEYLSGFLDDDALELILAPAPAHPFNDLAHGAVTDRAMASAFRYLLKQGEARGIPDERLCISISHFVRGIAWMGWLARDHWEFLSRQRDIDLRRLGDLREWAQQLNTLISSVPQGQRIYELAGAKPGEFVKLLGAVEKFKENLDKVISLARASSSYVGQRTILDPGLRAPIQPSRKRGGTDRSVAKAQQRFLGHSIKVLLEEHWGRRPRERFPSQVIRPSLAFVFNGNCLLNDAELRTL